MSDKMTVGQIVNEAARFGRYRWATVIRFAWLPALISLLVICIFGAAVIDLAVMQEIDVEAMAFDFNEFFRVPLPIVIGGAVVVYAFVFLLFSGVFASIFRLVGLGEERPGIFQLRMDGPAIRVFISFIIVGMISFVVWSVAFVVSGMLTGQSMDAFWEPFAKIVIASAKSGENYQPSAELTTQMLVEMKTLGLAFLIAFVPSIYVSIKLFPFPAASAIEDKLLLLRTFQMTSGNFWTILGSIFLMTIFLVIAGIIFEIASGIFQLVAEFSVLQGAVFAVVGVAIYSALLIAMIVFNAFVYAVQMSMPAIIYRRLSSGE